MSRNYSFLFPFERIPYGKKILIYGAGDMGYEYCTQLTMSSFATVIGFVDRNPNSSRINGIKIYRIDELSDVKFDYIIIALKSGTNANAAICDLVRYGVEKEKIIWIGPRKNAVLPVAEEDGTVFCGGHSLNGDTIRISIRCGAGIGDLIIRKPFIEALCNNSNVSVDFYAPIDKDTFEAIFSDCVFIRDFYNDGGAKYAARKEQYDLAITCSYIVGIDGVDFEKIERKSRRFAEVIRLLVKKTNEYGLSPYPTIQNYIHFERASREARNCISAYNYTGVCSIVKEKVSIPLLQTYEEKYNRLNLKNYITVNYGNDLYKYSDAEYLQISKQWPVEYFEKWIDFFSREYPDISIVQLGTRNSTQLKGADKYVLGESLELVKYVLKGSIFHLDIDGGLVHLATHLGTKCVVLFGPTPVSYFGYDQNINIVSEKCNNCSFLYPNIYRCARGFNEPECMYSITPEIVMEHVDRYMKKRRENEVFIPID